MKNLKMNLQNLTFILLILSFLSVILAGCTSGTDAESNDGINFSSGNIADGESFSFTFKEEATVPYYCQIHSPNPGMEGVITVSSDADISGEFEIIMEGLQFNPSSVTIAPGTTVTWINRDGVTHNILDGNPSNNGGGGPNY